MRFPKLTVVLALTTLFVGCESGELGMKIALTEKPAPATMPKTVAEAKTGGLTVIMSTGSPEEAQTLAQAVAAAMTGAPEGELTFTSLAIRNIQMQEPPRASAEIDAFCIWRKKGKAPVGYEVKLSTFSIEIEDWNKQLQYLRDEALKGMSKKLADAL